MAEGYINEEDLDGSVSKITRREFEDKWKDVTAKYKKFWDLEKRKYKIGDNVKCKFEHFYPQGCILSIGKLYGIYENRKSEINSSEIYYNGPIKGKVIGYDEENMWLIIS